MGFCMFWIKSTKLPPLKLNQCGMGGVICAKLWKKDMGEFDIRGNGWQVAIARGVDGYELVISHFGEQFATKIDYCPYCGAKMDGGAKE